AWAADSDSTPYPAVQQLPITKIETRASSKLQPPFVDGFCNKIGLFHQQVKNMLESLSIQNDFHISHVILIFR
ncbi:hypothetical protein ACI3PL_07450, partial [Lacticaseibacillus paracasei]